MSRGGWQDGTPSTRAGARSPYGVVRISAAGPETARPGKSWTRATHVHDLGGIR